MLVNATNVGTVMAHVAGYTFNRTTVELDVINNAAYVPGMLVRFYVDDLTMMQGYIQSCSFKFGLQARSTLRVIGATVVPTATLKITYMFGSTRLGKQKYRLPLGSYSIENPWFDRTLFHHRYILRPLTASVSGTLTSSGASVTVNYEAALDLYEGVLTITNVDEITALTESGESVGVIT